MAKGNVMPGKRNGPQKAPWPKVKGLVDDGATLQIHGGGHFLDIASLYQGEQLICMFHCERMGFVEIMDHLEELARQHNDKGVVSDEVN